MNYQDLEDIFATIIILAIFGLVIFLNVTF